jgi:hypothetical protein
LSRLSPLPAFCPLAPNAEAQTPSRGLSADSPAISEQKLDAAAAAHAVVLAGPAGPATSLAIRGDARPDHRPLDPVKVVNCQAGTFRMGGHMLGDRLFFLPCRGHFVVPVDDDPQTLALRRD